ncbi:MAG: hypothetical protein ACREJT_16975 [Myxococcota bacterium]
MLRKTLLSMLLWACSAAVAGAGDAVLELKDVQGFKLEAVGASPMTLELSGLAFHSALAVSGIRSERDGRVLHLLVPLVPARTGLSGSFDDRVEIPAGVDIVDFGANHAVIWTRDGGVTRY